MDCFAISGSWILFSGPPHKERSFNRNGEGPQEAGTSPSSTNIVWMNKSTGPEARSSCCRIGFRIGQDGKIFRPGECMTFRLGQEFWYTTIRITPTLRCYPRDQEATHQHCGGSPSSRFP